MTVSLALAALLRMPGADRLTTQVAGGVATAKWWPVEAAYQDTRRAIVVAESNSSGTITDEAMAEVGRQYARFVGLARDLMPYQRATILLATFYATFNMLVSRLGSPCASFGPERFADFAVTRQLNAGAISLVLLIRRQIKFNKVTASPGPTNILRNSHSNRPTPNRERSRQVRELRRVSNDQLSLSAFIVLLCIAWIPQTLFMVIGGIGIGLSWIRWALCFSRRHRIAR